jgi:ribosome assembly protein SQT1
MQDEEIKEEQKIQAEVEKKSSQEEPEAMEDEDNQSELDRSIEYIDEDLLAEMDGDDGMEESDDDFKTMKESEFGEDDQQYMDGHILEENAVIQNDSQCQLELVHQDHIYTVANVPTAPYNTFISGDGDDKCYVWNIVPEGNTYKCVKRSELPGHTETVEFIKFNHDGKLLVTGGMNNVLRVWSADKNMEFTVKCKLENGPAETDDILFVEWHPKGNALICGGKDFMIWLMNGATGDFLASFSGHEDEVLAA